MSKTLPSRAPKVLVVDDDPFVLDLFREILVSEGMEPLTAETPREAVELSVREDFLLAFVDIGLPEMSGLELAQVLKEHEPRRDVVIMTGYGTVENAVQAIKVGVADFIRKPFSLEDVLICINRHQERRAFRERIRRAEQRYYDLVQNIPLMIFTLRKDLGLDFVNEACRTMLGYAPKEVCGRPGWFLERIHEDDRERLNAHFQLGFAGQPAAAFVESRLIHREGHLIHCLIKSFPSSWHPGPRQGVPHLEGIAVDITDRVLLEKALVQKEKLKTLGAVAAEVAHEIRNPLVALGGFARRLRKNHPDSEEARIILDECRRLEKILDRVRNYLSPVEVSLGEHSLEEILNRCKELLSLEFERRGMCCTLIVEPNLPRLCVDPDLLMQVFINLVRNALQAMNKGDELQVKAYESDQHLLVRFRNPCKYALPDDQDALFLPFDEGGRSIGLPLCYRLIRTMGGLLSFEREDRHVAFTISLPKARAENGEGGEDAVTTYAPPPR
ncbi:PAS domain S-box-containing protein [Desulfacinum hydrothermale DSM 13146]|uniref:histidine kinase n=1 Tax=Desulfacinum hydrothermale DSM 13146 TaxID=1121390 RepID=A0A1W1XNS1_9BACT|nr:response regulator [Desulfacinum hydrothermale]SMC25619.1 PAS domain S-box-containing protein [Desulfacinum hydrothermale DSM 13146]